VPERDDSLRLALKHTHGQYAAYLNARRGSTGHVWQGRYYSCPLDPYHLWAALRYAELNPVRAAMVAAPVDYLWSSAAAHCGRGLADPALEMQAWRQAWSPAEWREYLEAARGDAESEAIRRSTHTGRPLGAPEFIEALEKALSRRLRAEKGGRPRKVARETDRQSIGYGRAESETSRLSPG
jgi:putative transposase